ncbi:MAG: hypothetical protein H7251_05140 [Acetobacteraceae bacterium]|nr:hypothetical protein [Acetobacteraceae bacterium]
MANPVEALILDLVEWVAAAPRSQAEVMEVWRTSCPRLPVWEEAVERGLVARGRVVTATEAGRELLRRQRGPGANAIYSYVIVTK